MINYHFDDTIHIHENSHIFFLKLVTRVEDFIVLIHTFFFFCYSCKHTYILSNSNKPNFGILHKKTKTKEQN